MLPMLTVTGAPGIVYLNGIFCGETGAAALPVGMRGVQYLELRPFDPDTPAAALRLTFEDGRLTGGVTGNAFAVQWPDGRVELEMRAPAREADAPRLLASAGEYLLVSENGAASFGRNAGEAVFLPVTAPQSATLRALAAPGLYAAEGECAQGRFAAVLGAQGAPEVAACACGATANVDANGTLRALEPAGDFAGHAYACTYAPDAEGAWRQVAREPAWEPGAPRAPQTPEETARAFLEAWRLGLTGEAARYAANPHEAARLAAAAGTYDAVVALPPDGSGETAVGVLSAEGEHIAGVRRIAYEARRDVTGAWKLAAMEEKACFSAI